MKTPEPLRGFSHKEAVFENGVLVGFSVNIDFRILEKALGNAFEPALANFMTDVETGVKAASPVLTGKNRDSIRTETEGNGITRRAFLISESGYGGWIEIGTKNRPAQPYIRPTIFRLRSVLLKGLENSI